MPGPLRAAALRTRGGAMKRRATRFLLPAILLLPAMSWHGGWVVITVDDVPEYAVSGETMKLAFTIRQHGVELMSGLEPVVVAENGGEKVKVPAKAAKERGRYVAPLTLAAAGEWTITIHSGYNDNSNTLPAMPVINAGAAPPAAWTDMQRGERLFVAKGCVTCHVQIQAGPKLGEKKYDAEWLGGFLKKPVQLTSTDMRMPDLGLKEPEIAALVSYINTGLGQ
jgi:mono/diheme cytochrome c family protein